MNGGGNADASDINASVVVLIADDDAKEPKRIFVIQFVRSCSEVQANVTTISAPCKPRQKRTLESVTAFTRCQSRRNTCIMLNL